MTNQYDQLRSDLGAISAKSKSVLQREHRKQNTGPALRTGAAISAVIALGILTYLGLATLTSLPFPGPSWISLSCVVLLPGAVYAIIRILAAALRSISSDQALAAADARHKLEDRLRTAAEFLGHENRSPFMDAALLDASAHADSVRAQRLPEHPVPSTSSARTFGWAALALACIAVACWIPTPSAAIDPVLPGQGEQFAQLEPAQTKPRQESKNPAATPKPEDKQANTPQQPQQPSARPSRKDQQAGAAEKKTQGAMGNGQSADAASASGKSQARGAPSSQAQASKTGKKSKKKHKNKKPKKTKPQETPKAPKTPNEDSGSTAGRGAASGSNKSPSASPWTSKDQVTSEDEEDLENDEEVDDEFDDSDSRGGVQPHLRDRRPPVNRDLGIGFGNAKNPDANGRGGPSEQKKSRGVASLVLGVPIPDHVKGMPNPGKTKITQERVEPQAETAKSTTASSRTPRQSPLGFLPRPQLTPWMRDLVRSYFRSIRTKPAKAVDGSKDPTPSK
jgi:hypothetical protein